MNRNIRLDVKAPAAYRALLAFNDECRTAAIAAGLGARLVELVRIRVSQLNGCAFCLRFHVHEALALGEHNGRLALLPAWRDTTYFSPRERASLAHAEAIVSSLHQRAALDSASDETLNDDQIAAVRWLAIAINAMNRVATASGMVVSPPTVNLAPLADAAMLAD